MCCVLLWPLLLCFLCLTWCVLRRCSETGAAFFSDMFSKHAMHSGAAEEVLYAGALPAVQAVRVCFWLV